MHTRARAPPDKHEHVKLPTFLLWPSSASQFAINGPVQKQEAPESEVCAALIKQISSQRRSAIKSPLALHWRTYTMCARGPNFTFISKGAHGPINKIKQSLSLSLLRAR